MPNKKKVLIVEDNDLNLKLFKDLLSNNGYDVVFTQDGFEALDLVQESLPDLIIMDIQLHGISGYDIIKDIKKDDKIKHIPVIAVTAFVMKDDKEKIMSSGCESYMAKPISIEPFLNNVRKYAYREEVA